MDAGDSADCNDWPLLTTYKWTDKMFNCSGNITGFVMCNKGRSHADVIISLWRGGNTYSAIVVYLSWEEHASDFLDNNYLSFSRGDQLMVLVIYYQHFITYFNSTIRYVYYTHVYMCSKLSQMPVGLQSQYTQNDVCIYMYMFFMYTAVLCL